MGNTMSWRPNYLVSVVLGVLGASCWSLGGALVRLTHGIDAWQIIFYRSLTLLVCMLIWLAAVYGKAMWRRIADGGVEAIVAGVAWGMAGLAFLASLLHTTVAQAIFMVGLSPFLSAIIGYWILRGRVSGITWVAMSMALAGMAIMLIGNLGTGSLIGTALAIYSAFCFSCYSVLLRWGQDTDMSVALIWNALFLIA